MPHSAESFDEDTGRGRGRNGSTDDDRQSIYTTSTRPGSRHRASSSHGGSAHGRPSSPARSSRVRGPPTSMSRYKSLLPPEPRPSIRRPYMAPTIASEARAYDDSYRGTPQRDPFVRPETSRHRSRSRRPGEIEHKESATVAQYDENTRNWTISKVSSRVTGTPENVARYANLRSGGDPTSSALRRQPPVHDLGGMYTDYRPVRRRTAAVASETKDGWLYRPPRSPQRVPSLAPPRASSHARSYASRPRPSSRAPSRGSEMTSSDRMEAWQEGENHRTASRLGRQGAENQRSFSPDSLYSRRSTSQAPTQRGRRHVRDPRYDDGSNYGGGYA